VIRWDAEWGVEFEVVGENPLEVWVAEKKAYEECDADDPSQPAQDRTRPPESAINGDP
jgi:hypothetical protein